MVTIRDIAEKAGVSKSTVSLALRGNSNCSAKTIKRITEIAKGLGYKPNPLVTANMTHMRGGVRRKNLLSNLAYFYDHKRGLPHSRPSYSAASERADELGFALEPFPYNDPKLKPDRLYRILRSRNVQGIVIGESPTVIPHIEFKWNDFAVVSIGYTLKDPRVDRIGSDHGENLVRLFHDLEERKYRRVGLALRSDFDDRVTHLPTSSYLGHQFDQASSESLPIYMEEKNWNKTSFFKWFSKHKPDCIITIGNEVGDWLLSKNLRIPEDIGVFSIWGGLIEQTVKYSHYNVSLEMLARAAVDVISDQLNSNTRGIPVLRRSILISSELVDLNSVRPIAK